MAAGDAKAPRFFPIPETYIRHLAAHTLRTWRSGELAKDDQARMRGVRLCFEAWNRFVRDVKHLGGGMLKKKQAKDVIGALGTMFHGGPMIQLDDGLD